MHSWLWALGFLLVGLIGWPSTRAQATSLAAAKWGLRTVLGATVLSGIGLCLAPDRVQDLAPAVETVGSGIGHLWHAFPRGGQWLIVAVALMLIGLLNTQLVQPQIRRQLEVSLQPQDSRGLPSGPPVIVQRVAVKLLPQYGEQRCAGRFWFPDGLSPATLRVCYYRFVHPVESVAVNPPESAD